jgi:hypothetical protein
MKLLPTLLKMQNQLRLYHWQSRTYAQHTAFGKAYKNIDSLVDGFVESYMGRYGNEHTSIPVTYIFELQSFDDNYSKFIDDSINFLESVEREEENLGVDLLNLRDELVGVFTQLNYLLSLE